MERIDECDVVDYAESVAANLEPVFEETYGIELDLPAFAGTRGGYERWGVAMVYERPYKFNGSFDHGRIKVRKDLSWPVLGFVTAVGHEMGHAALYQNSGFGEMMQDDRYDTDLLDAIDEGVAQTFEQDAFQYCMAEHGGIQRRAEYLVQRTAVDVRRSVTDTGLAAVEAVTGDRWRSKYSRGRTLFQERTREDVQEVITDPEPFYDQVKDEF